MMDKSTGGVVAPVFLRKSTQDQDSADVGKKTNNEVVAPVNRNQSPEATLVVDCGGHVL